MTFSRELWDATTMVRMYAHRQDNPLEHRRLLALADILDAEARTQRQREALAPNAVYFIPTEPLRRIG